MLLRWIRSEFFKHSRTHTHTEKAHKHRRRRNKHMKKKKITRSQADVPIMREPCLQPRSSALVSIQCHAANGSPLTCVKKNHTLRLSHANRLLSSVSLRFVLDPIHSQPLHISKRCQTHTQKRSTFRLKIQIFALQTTTARQREAPSGAALAWRLLGGTWRTPNLLNLNTKDFQQGGWRLLRLLTVFFQTALLSSPFLMIAAGGVKAVGPFLRRIFKN